MVPWMSVMSSVPRYPLVSRPSASTAPTLTMPGQRSAKMAIGNAIDRMQRPPYPM